MRISAVNCTTAPKNTNYKNVQNPTFKRELINQIMYNQVNMPAYWKDAKLLYLKLLKAVKAEKNVKIVEPELYKDLFFEKKDDMFDRVGEFMKKHDIYKTDWLRLIIAEENGKPLIAYGCDDRFPEDATIKHHGRYLDFYSDKKHYRRFGIYEEEGSKRGIYPYYMQHMYYADFWPTGNYAGNPRVIEMAGYPANYYNPDGSRMLFGAARELFQELFG